MPKKKKIKHNISLEPMGSMGGISYFIASCEGCGWSTRKYTDSGDIAENGIRSEAAAQSAGRRHLDETTNVREQQAGTPQKGYFKPQKTKRWGPFDAKSRVRPCPLNCQNGKDQFGEICNRCDGEGTEEVEVLPAITNPEEQQAHDAKYHPDTLGNVYNAETAPQLRMRIHRIDHTKEQGRWRTIPAHEHEEDGTTAAKIAVPHSHTPNAPLHSHPFLYHVAPRSAREIIEKEGLRRPNNINDESYWGYQSEGIYAWATPDAAKKYVRNIQGFNTGGNMVFRPLKNRDINEDYDIWKIQIAPHHIVDPAIPSDRVVQEDDRVPIQFAHSHVIRTHTIAAEHITLHQAIPMPDEYDPKERSSIGYDYASVHKMAVKCKDCKQHLIWDQEISDWVTRPDELEEDQVPTGCPRDEYGIQVTHRVPKAAKILQYKTAQDGGGGDGGGGSGSSSGGDGGRGAPSGGDTTGGDGSEGPGDANSGGGAPDTGAGGKSLESPPHGEGKTTVGPSLDTSGQKECPRCHQTCSSQTVQGQTFWSCSCGWTYWPIGYHKRRKKHAEYSFGNSIPSIDIPVHLHDYDIRNQPIESIKTWSGTVGENAPHVFRGIGSWHEALEAIRTGELRSRGHFVTDWEGETQFSSLPGVQDLARGRGTYDVKGIVEADVSNLPVTQSWGSLRKNDDKSVEFLSDENASPLPRLVVPKRCKVCGESARYRNLHRDHLEGIESSYQSHKGKCQGTNAIVQASIGLGLGVDSGLTLDRLTFHEVDGDGNITHSWKPHELSDHIDHLDLSHHPHGPGNDAPMRRSINPATTPKLFDYVRRVTPNFPPQDMIAKVAALTSDHIERFIREHNNGSPYVYHTVDARGWGSDDYPPNDYWNTEGVLTHGLIPWDAPAGHGHNWHKALEPRSNHVYLFGETHHAYRPHDASIRIDLRKLDPSKISVDEDVHMDDPNLIHNTPCPKCGHIWWNHSGNDYDACMDQPDFHIDDLPHHEQRLHFKEHGITTQDDDAAAEEHETQHRDPNHTLGHEHYGEWYPQCPCTDEPPTSQGQQFDKDKKPSITETWDALKTLKTFAYRDGIPPEAVELNPRWHDAHSYREWQGQESLFNPYHASWFNNTEPPDQPQDPQEIYESDLDTTPKLPYWLKDGPPDLHDPNKDYVPTNEWNQLWMMPVSAATKIKPKKRKKPWKKKWLRIKKIKNLPNKNHCSLCLKKINYLGICNTCRDGMGIQRHRWDSKALRKGEI